jgi:iron(III) transport system ATP-binding protein
MKDLDVDFPHLQVVGLRKSFSSSVVVNDVNLEVKHGDIAALLGPSGCGKTTLLRCIAGLEIPDTGVVRIAGEVAFDRSSGITVPVQRRGVGFVFQDYALWPHMTVEANVSYGLRIARVKRSDARERVHEVLDVVGLSGLSGRYPYQLSGGQQQRVALARSLVSEPRLLLLDEPLSNLDRKVRDEMRRYLRSVVRRLGVTAVLVTHDHTEAIALADVVYLMRDGEIVESGSAEEIYERPTTEFGAEFLGHGNVVRGRWLNSEETSDMYIRLENGIGIAAEKEGYGSGECALVIRAEDVDLHGGDTCNGKCSNATIEDRWYLGNQYEYLVDWAGSQLTVLSRTGPWSRGSIVHLCVQRFHVLGEAEIIEQRHVPAQ